MLPAGSTTSLTSCCPGCHRMVSGLMPSRWGSRKNMPGLLTAGSAAVLVGKPWITNLPSAAVRVEKMSRSGLPFK